MVEDGDDWDVWGGEGTDDDDAVIDARREEMWWEILLSVREV